MLQQKWTRTTRSALIALSDSNRSLSRAVESLDTIFRPTERKPYTHTQTIVASRDDTPLTKYNAELNRLANKGKIVSVFETAHEIKSKGIIPDVNTYNAMIRSCAIAGLPNEARSLIADMVLMGLKPDQTTFLALLQAERFSDTRVLYQVFDMMAEFSVQPNDLIYDRIIVRHAMEGQFEMCLRTLSSMAEQGIVPQLLTVHIVIKLVADYGNSQLATDLAFGFESQGVRKLETEVWMECLASCARNLDREGVLRCWNQLVHQRGVNPEEGLCLLVLNTAARYGLPVLADEAIKVLRNLVEVQEHHLEPVLEAYCKAGDIVGAIEVIGLMAEVLPHVDGYTLQSFTDLLASDTVNVDTAWTRLEDTGVEGKAGLKGDKVQRIQRERIFNCSIDACVQMGDLPRALGLVHSSGQLGITLGQETFRLLFVGAAKQHDRKLGSDLWRMLKEKSIDPDIEIYQSVIKLSLYGETYEEAFTLLEEMEKKDMVPSISILVALLKRCQADADPRANMVRRILRKVQPSKRDEAILRLDKRMVIADD